ncbi:hypothetical protein ACH4K8_04695 [Streptomyces anulatus]
MLAAHTVPVDGAPVVSWPVLQEYVAGEYLVVMPETVWLGRQDTPVPARCAWPPAH